MKKNLNQRVRVVVNPAAHSGRVWSALKNAGIVLERLDGTDFEWIESRSAEHFRELIAGAQPEGLHALALAGGDGTVAMALTALPSKNRIPIGILPVGSGNDFAFHCGVPRSLPLAAAALAHGIARTVDLGVCLPAGRRFCCVAAVGLDELALKIIYGSRWPRSKALNIYAVLRALASYRPRRVRVTWEGGRFEGEVMFVAVTNTKSYGGGFMVSPGAKLDDGKLDLCIVRKTPRLRLLTQFPRILKGTHGAMPEVTLAASRSVTIESLDGPLAVALDGELGHAETPVRIECQRSALNVLVPHGV